MFDCWALLSLIPPSSTAAPHLEKLIRKPRSDAPFFSISWKFKPHKVNHTLATLLTHHKRTMSVSFLCSLKPGCICLGDLSTLPRKSFNVRDKSPTPCDVCVLSLFFTSKSNFGWKSIQFLWDSYTTAEYLLVKCYW